MGTRRCDGLCLKTRGIKMLYIVATPIGNLKEITYRAVEVLKQSDIILAEDTRHSALLLKTYQITAPMISYQKFNERSRCEQVLKLLAEGKTVSLISDAGMPLVSDPGSVLLTEVIAAKYEYTVISGACAAVNALVLSGMDSGSFCMAGFLPEKNIDRVRYLDKFKALECTLIFYVSPHGVDKDLEFLFSALGARKAALVREISKMFEQVVRFNLGDVVTFTHKGEFVLVLEGAPPATSDLCTLTIAQHYAHYVDSGLDDKQAIKQVAFDRNVAKNIIYAQIKVK